MHPPITVISKQSPTLTQPQADKDKTNALPNRLPPTVVSPISLASDTTQDDIPSSSKVACVVPL